MSSFFIICFREKEKEQTKQAGANTATTTIEKKAQTNTENGTNEKLQSLKYLIEQSVKNMKSQINDLGKENKQTPTNK
jgi:hypothetical protein